MQFHLLITGQAVVGNLLGVGERLNNSITHPFKFPSYTIANLRTLVKQEV